MLVVTLLESHVEDHRLGPSDVKERWWQSSLFMGLLAPLVGGLLLACAIWTFRHALQLLRTNRRAAAHSTRSQLIFASGTRHGNRRAVGLLVVAGFLVLGGVILPWGLLRLALGL